MLQYAHEEPVIVSNFSLSPDLQWGVPNVIYVAWSRAIRHNLNGSEGRSIQEEKQAYYARLHAVLLRYTAYHIKALSNNT